MTRCVTSTALLIALICAYEYRLGFQTNNIVEGAIVIVDDNPGHALLTEEALREFFIPEEVIYLRTGAELLDYLNCRGPYEKRASVNPGIILLDLNMPNVSGQTVLQEIKQDKKLRTIPTIILSMSSDKKNIDHCYGLGANAYMVKNMDFEQYRREIKSLGEFWGFTNCGPRQTQLTVS